MKIWVSPQIWSMSVTLITANDQWPSSTPHQSSWEGGITPPPQPPISLHGRGVKQKQKHDLDSHPSSVFMGGWLNILPLPPSVFMGGRGKECFCPNKCCICMLYSSYTIVALTVPACIMLGGGHTQMYARVHPQGWSYRLK